MQYFFLILSRDWQKAIKGYLGPSETIRGPIEGIRFRNSHPLILYINLAPFPKYSD